MDSVGFAESDRLNSRGQKLLTVHYAPKTIGDAVPTAVLIWHHGYGEHVGRYRRGKFPTPDLPAHTCVCYSCCVRACRAA